jgi:ribonuclease HI
LDILKDVKVYVDGAWVAGSVGYGFVILSGSNVKVKRSSRVTESPWTDSRQVGGELLAVMNALRWCQDRKIKRIEVYYDYEGVHAWAEGIWKANKIITNDYRRFISESKVSVSWNKVRSHSRDPLNDLADQLAKDGANGKEYYWESTL